MKRIVPTLMLLIVTLLFLGVSAQTPSAKSLLWRIAGNGLQTPSYLYGTMHLKDRRLFFFGDSVYKNIESSKGFAMELDPEEMMDSLFTNLGEADTSSLLRKLMVEKKFRSVAKKLEKKFGIPAEKITRKQLIKDREKFYYSVRKKDDMQTFVDMYLYNIAHKSGRYVGGIEDVSDQLNLRDETGKDVNISDYLQDDDLKRQAYLENLITLYIAQDIDKINELLSDPASKQKRDILLVQRNIKMAQRMDSLAHIRNSFFAIGAAHLPGSDGVIKLLQEKGFTVTPVFSSKKIDPEKYTYTAKEIPWVKFLEPDSAYAVEMPGKASDLTYGRGELKFKVYADLVTNAFYMTGFSFHGNEENQDEMVANMMKSFLSKGFEKIEDKKVTNKGISGKEVIAIMGKIYYRLQFFPLTDKVFIIMTGGEKKAMLYTTDVEKFFDSFTMNASLSAKPNNWVTRVDSAKAFAAEFPKKPSMDQLKAGEIVNHMQTATYTVLDLPNDTYYMVVVSEPEKGYVMSADSLVFNAKLDYYKKIKAVVSDTRKFNYEGNAAMSFLIRTKQDGTDLASKMMVISRGNRSYTLAAITQKGREDYPDITRFFRAFKLTAFKQPEWSVKEFNGNSFSTSAPSAFEKQVQDTTGLTKTEREAKDAEAKQLVQIFAHDPYSAVTYYVNIKAVSKYYQAKTDSIFIEEQSKTYYTDSTQNFAKKHPGAYDSLVYKKAITNGKAKGYEMLIKNASKNYYNRVRILPHGDSAYHLFVWAPYDIVTSQQVNHFFDDFRFREENIPSSIAQNKTAVILQDLAGIDSLTVENAKSALSATNFESGDLPLLFKAYLTAYPADTLDDETINEKISNAINKIHDTAVIAFVKDNYSTTRADCLNFRSDMLHMLAKQQTVAAVSALKELLLKDPLKKGSPNSFIYELRDSVALVKALFPEAAKLFGDSIMGPGIIMLAARLVDSNLLQKDIITVNSAGILLTAKRQLKDLKKDDYVPFNNELITVLGQINSPQSIEILNGFVKKSDVTVKQAAVLTLLKINQVVSPAEIRKLAANTGNRIYFYKALVKSGKRNFFPAEFLIQQKFAESYLQEAAMDEDYEEVACTFVTQKTAVIKGVQQKFYLFKVSFNQGEESHLGICGPFDARPKTILPDGEHLRTTIYYDEKYAPLQTDKLFSKFLRDENGEMKTPDEN